jgi:hypothetical protein
MALDDSEAIEGLDELAAAAEEQPVEDAAEAPEPVTDPSWGQVIDTVDVTGDGIADVTLRDANGDSRIDYVEGDLTGDGIDDVQLQDADGDGTLDSGPGAENWHLLSDINDMDVDWIERDSDSLDSDDDGVTNLEERDLGSNTLGADTDGDGLEDGSEVAQGSDPTDWASNQDAEAVAWDAQLAIESQVETASADAASEASGYDATADAGYEADTSSE